MVRDRDVLVTQRPRRLRHLLQRRPPVGFRRVHVQIAANIAGLHQLRQPPLRAASISPWFSRSSGGIHGSPSAS